MSFCSVVMSMHLYVSLHALAIHLQCKDVLRKSMTIPLVLMWVISGSELLQLSVYRVKSTGEITEPRGAQVEMVRVELN